MPFGGLLTGGLILAGGAANFFGAKQNADANQKIAEEQLGAAKETRNMALGYAQPTWGELQNLQNELNNQFRVQTLQDAALQRDKELLAARDPAFIQAGHQALQLMQGQDAAVLAPFKTQRALQRSQLVNSLQKQLGSGYANSSAGVEALTRFDQETSMMTSQLQQQTLSQLMGFSANPNGMNYMGDINSAGATLGELQSQYMAGATHLQDRMVAATEGTSLAPYAGASNVGAAAMGQYMGNMGNQLMGTGSTMAALQLGKSLYSNNSGTNSASNTGADPMSAASGSYTTLGSAGSAPPTTSLNGMMGDFPSTFVPVG